MLRLQNVIVFLILFGLVEFAVNRRERRDFALVVRMPFESYLALTIA